MKKATSILLVLAMVLSLCSITAFAEESAGLPEAADGVITLTGDVTLSSAAVFGEGERVTLDLNGYTLSGPDGGLAIALEKGANLTVKDGSEAQSGAIAASGEGSTGVYLNGSGNTLRLQSGAIRADGRESVAIFVKGDSQPENYASNAVQLRGGSVSAAGESAQAISVIGSANFITLNGCAVRAEGDYVYGVALNTLSDQDAGGSQFTMTKGSVTVIGSLANAIYSESPASGQANSISIMEYGTTTVSASGTRANAVVAQNYNEVEISGGTISADNSALSANQKDKVVVSGGTLSGAVGVNVACGSGGSVQFNESWDGSAPTVTGSTAAVKAQYTWRGRSDDSAMIQITAGSFDGAITSDATKTGDDQDAYTYYDITGGSFSAPIEDSAYYNFAAAKGLTPGEYDASKETNTLEQREDGRYYVVEKTDAGDAVFALVNIPYSEFYASESAVDTISSATLNGKARNINVNGASYHQSEAAVSSEGIAGAMYPVKLSNSDLEALRALGGVEVTDADSIQYEMNARGQIIPVSLNGANALQEKPSYSYYILSEEPDSYKELTVADDGTVTFGKAVGTPVAGTANGTATIPGRHASVEIALDGVTAAPNDVSGVIVTAGDESYALHHVVNIWRGTEIGWNLSDLDLGGKTITNIRYFLKSGSIQDYSAEIALPQSGYVLMNIPYADFYAGEGVEGVEAVSSATKNKPRTGTLAGGSYHVNSDGSDISGVIYPVFVKDMSALANCTEITDASSVDITVTNRGKETTTTYSGKDALFESADYAYYVLSEMPARYKTLTVSEGGTFSFSAVSGRASTVADASGAVNEAGHHADVEISLSGTTGIAQGQAVSGVIVTFSDGTKIALRHIANIWRATELGGSMAEFAGKTITNVRYYTQDAVIDFPMTVEIKKAPGEMTAAFNSATELQLSGLPEDIENPAATVQTKVGRGETPVVIAENAPVADGIVTVSEADPDTVYTVTVSSDNYLPMSAEAQYEQPTSSVVITTQPENYVGKLNSVAAFIVAAEGDGLTYQWQYSDDNGATWTDSSVKKAVYSTKLTENRDGRMVRCIVTNADGVSVSSESAVMQITALSITAQPQNYVGKVNSVAKFTVVAEGKGLTYQWQYSDDGGATWTDSSVKKAVYTTRLTNSRDDRMVRCVVTDADGNVVFSESAVMQITAVSITTQPQDYVGKVNSVAKFTVVAEGKGLSYQWQISDDAGATWTDSSVKKAVYSTKLTENRDGRMVRCIVTDGNGDSVFSNEVTMNIG